MLEQLTDLLARQEFRNFAVVTTAGVRYEISDPELVVKGKAQLHYYFPGTDRAVHIPYNQIATVKELPTTKSRR